MANSTIYKKFYESKTFWVNLISLIGLLFWGTEVDPLLAGQILAFVNIVLRFLTKKPIDWGNAS